MHFGRAHRSRGKRLSCSPIPLSIPLRVRSVRAVYNRESLNVPTSRLVTHPLLDQVSQRTRSLLLVFLCTLFGAAAQILMKIGTKGLPAGGTFVDTIIGIFTNPYLFAGYSLYGLSAVLLILALRHGELSILYPVIALTYVWVAILSVVIFHEDMPPLRILGIATVVVGVAVLGRSR